MTTEMFVNATTSTTEMFVNATTSITEMFVNATTSITEMFVNATTSTTEMFVNATTSTTEMFVNATTSTTETFVNATTLPFLSNGSYENATKAGRTEAQKRMVDIAQNFLLDIVTKNKKAGIKQKRGVIVTVMLGVGCSLSLKMIWKYMKRPREFITGLCLQLFGMPLVGLAITQILRMDTPEALGVIVQSIVPGGGYSNLVTYWLDGDMNLSAVMTGTSTLLSFGTMSLWLLIISKILRLEQKFLIPYRSVGIGAAATIAPLIVGIIIRHFLPKIAPKITKALSIIGTIGIGVTFVLNGVAGVYDAPFSYKVFLAAILLITTAVCFGYAASRVPWLKLEPSCRRTIAVETVYQNTPLAFSIIVLTFSSGDPEIFGLMSFFPILYILLLVPLSAVVIFVYKILKVKGVKWVSADKVETNGES